MDYEIYKNKRKEASTAIIDNPQYYGKILKDGWVWNSVMGVCWVWQVKFFEEQGAIVKKDGEWRIACDKPVGIVYNADKEEKKRIYGDGTKESVIEALRKIKEQKQNAKCSIEYYPCLYPQMQEFERRYKYGVEDAKNETLEILG